MRQHVVCLRVGVVAGLLALSLLLTPGAQAVRDEPPPWEDGVVVLTLVPSVPDAEPYIELVKRVAADPGGFVEETTRGVEDYQRVCGGPAGGGEIAVVRFPDEATAVRMVSVLGELPGVATVSRNHYLQAHDHGQPSPSEDLFPQQWNLLNVGQPAGYYHYDSRPGEDIRAVPAWRGDATGAGQVVAILDEGFDVSHPDLAPNLWVNTDEIPDNGVDDDDNGWVDDVHGWDYIENDPHPRPDFHGTHVAGIVAAADDGVGITGVAPEAKLMSVGFLEGLDPRSVTELRALGAFAYAIANGATVINNSWGMYAPVGVGSPLMREAIQCAERHDIVLAWSAGNASAVPDWPQAYPSANSVRSTSFNSNGCHNVLTQPNPLVADVMAPGVDIVTTFPDGAYGWFSGTSAASPHTAGVAALVRQMHPELSAAEVVTAIRAGVRRTEFIEPQSNSWGYLSAAGALEAAATGARPAEPSVKGEPTEGAVWRCNIAPTVD